MTRFSPGESSETTQTPRPAKKKAIRPAIFLILSLAVLGTIATQSSPTFQDVQADDLFRQALGRFHDGYHTEAVQLLQRVLSIQPNNDLARTWLGRAFYYAGFENNAVQEWTTVREAGQGSPALTSFMETLEARRGLSRDVQEDFNFFPVYQLAKDKTKPNEFRRPSSVIPLSDGSNIVSSFGTNALVVVDANGKTRRTLRGGFTHYEGPFDMVLVGGKRIFSTQMLSDQVFELDMNGGVVKMFGEHGTGRGGLMGPQFIAWDGGQFLFVSDFGNRRVSKWDLDGNFILSFGEKSDSFAGLERPTGLVWTDGHLIVGDASRHNPALYIFDGDGNPVSVFSDERLAEIEDLEVFGPDELIVTTRTSIYSFHPSEQVLTLLHSTQDLKVRYTSARLDANGNIVASDFDTERYEVLSRLAGVYSGLHVQINRVVSDRFPEMVVDLSVLDNLGNPVVGLEKENFHVTEGRKDLNDFQFLGAGWRESNFDTVILAQSDQGMAEAFQKEALSNAVGGIFDALGNPGAVSLISAAENATIEAPVGSNRETLLAALENLPHSPFWYLDLGLRQAVPQLVKSQGLRHILFVGRGDMPEDAFARYGLEENANYLRNNRVRFSFIQTEDREVDPALKYLVETSGGLIYKLYDPKGLTSLKDDLLPKKDGSYLIGYRSLFDSDFGRKYLPVEVEAKLFQKSGRDEAGYFAPLKL